MLSFGLADLRATTPLGRAWLAVAALAGWVLLALVFVLLPKSLELSHTERAHRGIHRPRTGFRLADSVPHRTALWTHVHAPPVAHPRPSNAQSIQNRSC